MILYRAVSSDFNSAIVIATVGGNFFYDKSTSPQLIQYYYWITIVSVNGTVGAPIGPASAIAKPPIASVIEGLTAQIDAGFLAQSLKTEIDKITLNYAELTAEIANRVSANSALSAALADVQNGLAESLAFIDQEITIRQEGDSALVSQLNTVAAVNAQNAAAILTEQTARVTADSALANSITTLTVASNNNAAAITTEATARASADSALSSQITTAQSTLSGNIASVQTNLQTNINTVNGKVTQIGARYTAVVSVNGLIGGFGVYNDGSTVEAGFDVDTFWVGKTQANKRKPFIISGGVTYIDEAAIEKLTFTKLRDSTGAVVIENGKIKANYLNVTTITGGAYTGYAWPAAGQSGFYLGPGGLLMGNAYNGKYFQLTDAGDLYAPGFSIVNGNATFSGNLAANTVTTTSIAGAGVTQGYSSSTAGSSTALTVTVPTGTSSILVVATIGSPYTVESGSGEYASSAVISPMGSLYLTPSGGSASLITQQRGTLIHIFNTPGAGTYTLTLNRDVATSTMSLSVLMTKR